jgi:O-antigen/teichoic acid export membrane protein
MSLAKKIAHNTLIQTIGKFFSIFLGLIALSIMTRYLGPESFGQYTIVVAFIQFFAILSDMGLQLITVRMLSEPNIDEEKILNNILTLRIFISVIVLSLAPLVVIFFPYPPVVKIAVSVFILSFFLISLIQVLTGLFQKKLQIIKVTLGEIVGRIFLILSIYIAIYFNLGLIGIMSAGIIANLINFGYLLKATQKIIKVKLAFDFDIWKQTLQKSWPIAISIAFNLIYLKTDTIILSLYHPQIDVGIYGASFRFLEILIMIPTMFMGLILPLLSNYWANKNILAFKKMLQMAFNVIIIMIAPMIVGTLFLAEPIMVLVAGKDFAIAAPVLKIIILASAIVFIGTLYGHTIVAIEKQRKMIWAYGITAALSLSAYFLVIPKFSYFGAAWATVFAESLIAIATFWMVTKTTKIWPQFKIIFKALFASCIMATILYFTADHNIFLSISLAVITYFGSLYLIKGFSKEFIQEIIKIK